MKRTVSLFLAIVLLFGCGVATVSAENSKLLPDLQEALKTMAPDDEIGLYISYNLPVVTVADMPSWPNIYEARREYFAFTDEKQAEIQAVIFEGIDAKIGFQGVHNMVLAHVRVSDVEKIASYDIVRDIDYYPDTLDEPAIDPEPELSHTRELWERGAELSAEDIEEAANEQLHSRTYFYADKITLRNAYRFHCTPAYIVDYEAEGYGYYLTVIMERIFGDYLFYSTSSYEPSIFVDDHLYTLTVAYRDGVLTQEMLEELADTDYKCGNRCRIITRNVKGDADGSGEVDIVDATVIQRYDARIIGAGGMYRPLGDVDGDGDVNVIDATYIQRYEVGLYEIG